MPKRRSSCLSLFVLTLVAILCLAVIAAAFFVLYLPARAERAFGPPTLGLGPLQQTYLSTLLLIQENDLTLPHDSYGPVRSFQVQLGESTRSITGRLESEGLIGNAEAFRNYLAYSGLDTTLQAGEYKLSPAMTPLQIARELQDATPAEVTFRILPGWRLEEIAAALPTSGLEISPAAFQEAASQPPNGYDILQNLPPHANLEGFMLPGTYEISRTVTADEFIRISLDRFDQQVDNDLRQGLELQGLNLYQAVTLASMVEREAVVNDEMPMIASVFLNRLAAGLKLDSDPTVQYALGYNSAQESWWTNPLSLDDLQVSSRYNTYLYSGLPPGPIANPSLQALQAVAFPAQTPYYYFRAACDGSGKHVFSETLEQHVNKACR